MGIECNLLDGLPEGFAQMESLEVLYVGGNHLTSLPSNFRMMKSLDTISLGPLNRFRFTCPRTCWLFGLRGLRVKANASTEEAQALHDTITQDEPALDGNQQ